MVIDRKKPHGIGIAAKVLGLAMVLILLLAGISAYSYLESRDAMRNTAMLEVVAEARTMLDRIDIEIFARMHELVQATVDPFLIEALTVSNAEFDAMDDPEAYISEVDSDWSTVPFNETTDLMEDLMNCMLAREFNARYITHYREDHGVDTWGRISVLNKYGAVVAMTQRTADYRQNDEDWWIQAALHEHYVSDAVYDPFSDMYAVRIAVEVKDTSGEFMGEVMGFANIIEISRLAVTGVRQYESLRVLLTNSSGGTIFSSDAYVFLHNASSEGPSRLKEADAGSFIADASGGRHLIYGYATSLGYLNYDGHRWVIYVGLDLAEIFAPANELASRIAFMSVVVVALGVFLALVLSRTITRPIVTFQRTAMELASGDLERRVDITSGDEIGDLARTFNVMADKLEESHKDLEDRVVRRTRDLAAANEELKLEIAERKKSADALEFANKKLRFLGHITRHDIKNQLTVMRGWLSIAGETTKDPKDAETIMRAERAAHTIDSLLDFTGEYEKVGIENPEWSSLRRLFADGVMGLDTHQFSVVLDLEGVEILCDRMFSKVFRNLVDNTIRHGEKATKISVKASERPEGLVIVYEDDGVGIDSGDRDKMFQRGYGKHTGLGLYLVKEILTMAGMSVEAVLEPGKGARFEITVPKDKYRTVREIPQPAGRRAQSREP